MPDLVVVGSCNMDLVARTDRLPLPGETLIARTLAQTSGGKGANQAVAAARLGVPVSLVSAVGDDQFGHQILKGLIDEGVDVTNVRSATALPTGTAMIVVDDAGENTIIVSPGAGNDVTVEGCDLTAPQVVLAQMEIPLDTVADAARRTAGMFCLNASPPAGLPDELVARCDLIIVNQTEYHLAREQLDQAALVCVTLGAGGAMMLRRGQELARASSPVVDAVDTVGAGDAFTGALIAEILRTGDPVGSLPAACQAGAFATTRKGAQASLPTREELNASAN